MSTGKKIAVVIIVIVVTVLVGLVVIVPLLLDVDRYRPQVARHIQEETGKPAEIRRLALTVFPTVSIRVDDFTLGNPPGFPEGYLLKARRIYAVLDAGELWHRRVVVKSLELDELAINLLSDSRGRWNFESTAKQKTTKKVAETASEPPLFTLGVISKVKVARGQLTAANLLASGRKGPNFFEAHDVSSTLERVDLSAFVTSTSLAAPAILSLPPESVSTGGWVGALYAATPQSVPAAQGDLRADSLRFGSLQATRVKFKVRLFAKQVFFDDLTFDLYGGHAVGALSFNFSGQNPRYITNARVSGVDMARLLEASPDARGKMTGKMEGNLKLSGEVVHSPDPLAGMRGTGQVSIRDGRLPSLQLNRNLSTLARLGNLGPASGDPSSFSSMSADLNIANQRISSNKVVILGNGIEVNGSGSLSLAGAGSLDYEGVAKLMAGQSAVTDLLVNLSGATYADGKLTFPFTLGGTLQNPKFNLKSGGGAGNLGALGNLVAGKSGQQGTQASGQNQPQPGDLVQGITGLFKKKQSSQQQPQQPKP